MAENEMLTDVPLTQIRDFLHHPYLVKDDESMDELVDSIKERGLIQPVIIRPVDNGMYEMVSGHRRKRAFEIAREQNPIQPLTVGVWTYPNNYGIDPNVDVSEIASTLGGGGHKKASGASGLDVLPDFLTSNIKEWTKFN